MHVLRHWIESINDYEKIFLFVLSVQLISTMYCKASDVCWNIDHVYCVLFKVTLLSLLSNGRWWKRSHPIYVLKWKLWILKLNSWKKYPNINYWKPAGSISLRNFLTTVICMEFVTSRKKIDHFMKSKVVLIVFLI